MFDLEQSIAEWRRQMLAAGIKSPVPLEELECHLREDVERRVQSGGNLRAAFEAAVRQIGQPDELKFEFGKVGATRGAPARVRQAMRTLAGIPNHYQDTTMNTTDLNSNLEPRWATYLKAAVFLAPALGLWAIASVFLFPKLQRICQEAGVAIPTVYRVMRELTDHNLFIGGGLIVALALLERRSRNWPRYRRAAIGISVFLLNTAVLILITLMVLLALLVAPALLHHAQ